MAISYLEVDTGSLKADSNEMETQVEQAKTNLAKLTEELETLNSMWTGAANLAFRSQATEDIGHMSDMLTVMTELIESCKNAVREYDRCEEEVLAEVNSIRL
jgi:WXG100 family type VII secretion target